MENNINIVELLEKEKPMFHLLSMTEDMPNVEEYLFKMGKADTSPFSRTSYPIESEVLKYISSIVGPHCVTLETGGGNSTAVFATKSRKHICVNPDVTSNQLIRKWLQSKGCSCDNLYFVEESSDKSLPKLELTHQVDVALIDGSHSFPFPIIDWHFIHEFLVIGSKLLLDDIQIHPVRIVADFLLIEPAYKQIDTIGRCAVFEKVKDSRTMGWLTQEKMMKLRSQDLNKRSATCLSDRESIKPRNRLSQVLINGLKKVLPASVVRSVRRYYRRPR